MKLNGMVNRIFKGKKVDLNKINPKKVLKRAAIILGLSTYIGLQAISPSAKAYENVSNIEMPQIEQYDTTFEATDDITLTTYNGYEINIGEGEIVLAPNETYQKEETEYRHILYENEQGEYFGDVEEKLLKKSNFLENMHYKFRKKIGDIGESIENLANRSPEKNINGQQYEIPKDIIETVRQYSENRRYVKVPKEQGSQLNMRQEPKYDSGIIVKIPDGSEVYVIPDAEPIKDGTLEYIQIQYEIDGKKEIGYVSNSYLIESRELTEKIVSIPENEGNALHLRKEASYDSETLIDIPEGSSVYIIGEDKIQDGKLEYIKVEYRGKDGIISGYVANKYLADIENDKDEQNENSINKESKVVQMGDIKTNNEGTITFSDGSELSPEKIRSLIENGTRYEGTNEKAIPENMRGDIQVLVIKMGGTRPNYEMRKYNYSADNDSYKNENNEYRYLRECQVESVIECEKNNQPYAMYYFAQGTNESEGIIEGEQMIQNIKDLRHILWEHDLEMNNCLFYAVDIESDAKQNYRNVPGTTLEYTDETTGEVIIKEVTTEGVTESTIATLEKLQEAGFPTVLYTDGRHIKGVDSDSEEILLDIEKIAQKIPDLKIWQTACCQRDESGQQIENCKEIIQNINNNSNTKLEYLGTQRVLQGIRMEETDPATELDYSDMTVEMYKKLFKEMKEGEYTEERDIDKVDTQAIVQGSSSTRSEDEGR